MIPAIRAGALYFAAVFALGFLLGTIRVMALVPNLGEAAAVLLELPVMLAASWFLCGLVLSRIPVKPSPALRLLMGAVAFLLLMTAELVLGLLMGNSLQGWLAGFSTLAGALGLSAQVLYALFPFWQTGRA